LLYDEACERRLQDAQPSEGDLGRADKHVSDELVEDLCFVSQELGQSQHISFCRRVHGTQRGYQSGANTAAGEPVLLVGLVVRECKLARAAICGRLAPGERKQRPNQPSLWLTCQRLSRAHAEDGAPAWR
jgi:hypothetical protein